MSLIGIAPDTAGPTSQPDPKANPDLQVGAGQWRGGFSPAHQADWADKFAALALCKPYVNGVYWAHLSDAVPHHFPNCGLLDADGSPKPALSRLKNLRSTHLR